MHRATHSPKIMHFWESLIDLSTQMGNSRWSCVAAVPGLGSSLSRHSPCRLQLCLELLWSKGRTQPLALLNLTPLAVNATCPEPSRFLPSSTSTFQPHLMVAGGKSSQLDQSTGKRVFVKVKHIKGLLLLWCWTAEHQMIVSGCWLKTNDVYNLLMFIIKYQNSYLKMHLDINMCYQV